jgi:glutamyl-tRNA synthetase
MMPVYRFAPSPTGFLHVGGARTAIFNWLLARRSGGKILLRIEDTDRQRSTVEFIKQIQDSLSWLGIDWDAPPVYQSGRLERHREVVRQLVEANRAYPCYCTREELEEKRRTALARKEPLRYDGTCRDLSDRDRNVKEAAGIPAVIRLKTGNGEVVFNDAIHGRMQTPGEEIDDFVILRSDGSPVYQIAVVVDDHDMGITHVVRGDDHLPNTPKQILIYKALEWSVPHFGHLPLILGPDRNRLSKRHGATSVEEFRSQGILSEALFNYLCLLGWSPGDDREILSRGELIDIFDTGRINKSGAVFDQQKLVWMNSKYLAAMTPEQLLKILSEYVSEEERKKLAASKPSALLLMDLLRERCKTIRDLVDGAQFFLHDPEAYDGSGVVRYFDQNGSSYLEKLRAELSRMKKFEAQTLESEIRNLAMGEGVGAGKVIHPLRLALTGKTSSPGIFEIMEVLGKTTSLRRIDRAMAYIDSSPPENRN